MAKYPRVREQHVAVFGESGSGKTVLVTSFFGRTQEGSHTSDLWNLVAADVGQGIRLYKNYLGMRDEATRPPPSRFANTRYDFRVRLTGGDDAAAKKRPFDELRLAWHDYPGGWFEAEPSSAEERDRRTDTFRSLLRSDVALLLVDGQMLVDHRGEEERYLKALLGTFHQTVLSLKDDLMADEGRIVEFPRIWILGLSKADLLPDWDVDTFRDLMILKVADDIERLRSTIGELIETPDALSIGEDFMLLSSAKFQLRADSPDPVQIDLGQRIGLDLILPIASLLPLERRARWHETMAIPRAVLSSLADGAELLAAGLTGKKFPPLEKLLATWPSGGGKGAAVAPLALKVVAEAVQLGGDRLREMNEQARAQHDVLRATLTQMKLDLERATADRVIRNPR